MAASDVPLADRTTPFVAREAGIFDWAVLTGRPFPFPLPGPEEVAVWSLTVPPTVPVPPLWERVLDAAERARGARLQRAADRRRFVLSHGLLRLLLAAWTGCDPAAIAYVVSERGKPSLAGPGPAFSLSQAGDCVMVAGSAGSPVGVDVEPVRPLPEAEGIASRFFAPEERLARVACAACERDEAFLRLWTRKEAYLKALGVGLSRPLADFAVSLDDPARVLRPLPDAPRPGPRLCALPAPAGYVAAVAGWCDRVVCRELVLGHGVAPF